MVAITSGESYTAKVSSRANGDGLKSDALMERWRLVGLCSPALLLITVVMILPFFWLFYLSFLGDDGSFSLVHYHRLIKSKSYLRIFQTTFEVSMVTTMVCIMIGYPLAYMLSQLPRRMANLCMIAVLLPFWTSLLVRTYAWLVLLQRKGLVNDWGISMGLWEEPIKIVHNFNGTIIGMVHIMLPFLILPVYGSMKAIDKDYLKAAANLGASPSQAFWRVFFPLSMPGLLAGALIVFVLCLGFYVTPAVLGGGKIIMVAMRIASNIEIFFNWGAASALGVVLLVMTLIILYIATKLMKFDQVMGSGGQH